MSELPDLKIDEPDKSGLASLKNSTVFIASTLLEIFNISVTTFKLNSFNISTKIIIICFITILILVIDVIILYIKDRENRFEKAFYVNMYQFLKANLSVAKNRIDELNNKMYELEKKMK